MILMNRWVQPYLVAVQDYPVAWILLCHGDQAFLGRGLIRCENVSTSETYLDRGRNSHKRYLECLFCNLTQYLWLSLEESSMPVDTVLSDSKFHKL